MRTALIPLPLWALGLLLTWSCADAQPASAPRQHLLIVAEDDASTNGLLHRFARSGQEWSRVGAPVPVVFGRGGVGPKVEGDGRSPEGRFGLGPVFGYAPLPPETRMPYRALGPATVCVDDPASADYNRIIEDEPAGGPRTFASAERMRRDLAYGDGLYEHGVVIRYNEEGARDASTGSGLGSCIFLHVWRGPDSPTVGCTAMAAEALLDLIAWLDPAAEPVVIQGTRAYLADLAGSLPYPLPAPRDEEASGEGGAGSSGRVQAPGASDR